jgi:dihydrodipicolinate reductase
MSLSVLINGSKGRMGHALADSAKELGLTVGAAIDVGDDLAAVKAHVSGCDTCARFGGAFARAVTALRAPAADTDGDGADDDFTAGVLDALDP